MGNQNEVSKEEEEKAIQVSSSPALACPQGAEGLPARPGLSLPLVVARLQAGARQGCCPLQDLSSQLKPCFASLSLSSLSCSLSLILSLLFSDFLSLFCSHSFSLSSPQGQPNCCPLVPRVGSGGATLRSGCSGESGPKGPAPPPPQAARGGGYMAALWS